MEDYGAKAFVGEVVEREKHVSREVNRGLEVAREVQKYSEELEMRLQPILQVQPKGVQGGNAPSEPIPPLAEALKTNREITESAVYNLKSILSRLEL